MDGLLDDESAAVMDEQTADEMEQIKAELLAS